MHFAGHMSLCAPEHCERDHAILLVVGCVWDMKTDTRSRNASAVSDAPHQKSAGRFVRWCGAHPIQLFEGSRPWVGSYAN
jgi:hypothetical protein